MLKDRFNSGVKHNGKTWKWDTVILDKTQELARFLLDLSKQIDFIEPRPSLRRSDTQELRKRILDLTRALDPEFLKSSFEAEFTDRRSPFDAFLAELGEINRLCKKAGEPPLLRETFDEHQPEGFSWITKPIAKDYYDFVLVFDKLVSENLNKDFFRGKTDLTEEIQTDDSKVRIQDKRTIQLLSDYLSGKFGIDSKDSILETFRLIRKERQKPAHKIPLNEFDPSYFRRQQKLVYGAYVAVRRLRTLLASD